MTSLSSRPRGRFWFLLGGLGLVAALAYSGRSRGESPGGERAPDRTSSVVLVELFSSEGCSSCPPADRLLRELDRAGAVNAVRVVALEFHVDYWDDLGWKDPFSRAAWSERQRDYAGVLGGGLYTPQMVVDGRDGFVGSDARRARDALARAAGRSHVPVQLTRSGASLTVRIPKVSGPVATAWLAVSERDLETRVERGENAGRTLPHGPIVRSLERLPGELANGLERTVEAPASKGRLSFAVFVQRNESREVVGAAAL